MVGKEWARHQPTDFLGCVFSGAFWNPSLFRSHEHYVIRGERDHGGGHRPRHLPGGGAAAAGGRRLQGGEERVGVLGGWEGRWVGGREGGRVGGWVGRWVGGRGWVGGWVWEGREGLGGREGGRGMFLLVEWKHLCTGTFAMMNTEEWGGVER